MCADGHAAHNVGRKHASACMLERNLGVAEHGSLLEGASQGHDDGGKSRDGEEEPKPLDGRHNRHRAHVQADDPHSWQGQGQRLP